MEFGIYHEFTSKAGRSDAESFDLALDIVDAAEEYGLDVMWLAELHFDPARAVLASPMVVGAAIAARTKRMKIGTSVQVLPLSNPLRLAEEAATLDQLSHGRLIFGAGRSGVAKTYENYNIPYAESKERFNEALEIIERAWRETDFSHNGKYYQFEEVTVAPRPYQQPTPEVRVAAASADTFPTLGQEGRGMFISVRHEDASHFLAPIQIYRSEWAKAGHAGNGRVYLRAPGFVASTAAKAREAYEPTLMHHFRAQARLLADSARRLGQGPENPRWKTVERLENITYDEAIRGSIYVGTPDMVIEKLQATDRDIGGMAGIQLEFNCGGLADHAAERESMRLLCKEVKPAFAS